MVFGVSYNPLFVSVFRVLERLYDEDGYCMPTHGIRYTQGPLTEPQRLLWDVSPELETSIEKALTFARAVSREGQILDIHYSFNSNTIRMSFKHHT